MLSYKYGFWEILKRYEALKLRQIELMDSIIRAKTDERILKDAHELKELKKEIRRIEVSEVFTKEQLL